MFRETQIDAIVVDDLAPHVVKISARIELTL